MPRPVVLSTVVVGTFIAGIACGVLLLFLTGPCLEDCLSGGGRIGARVGTWPRRRPKGAVEPGPVDEGEEGWDTYEPDEEIEETAAADA